MHKGLLVGVLSALLSVHTSAWAADLSGTWVLDLAASDPVDELLKAQGVGWVQRKAVANAQVTQTISQSGSRVTVSTSSSVKDATETLEVDGVQRTVEGEKGAMQVRHEWQGEDLVTTATAPGEFTLVTRRSLSADGAVLTQRLTLSGPDGAVKVEIDRLFRKS